jgi:drug/metabolite transporter (DMT)-like permease
MAFWRWVIAWVVLLPFAHPYLKRDWPIIRKYWKVMLLIGLFGIAIFNTLIYVAGHTTEAVNMSLVGSASPIFILLIGACVYKEPLSKYSLLGIILCITGLLIVLARGELANLLALQFTIGDLWVLLAAFIWGLYTLLLKRKPVNLSLTGFMFALFTSGLIFLFPAYLVEMQMGNHMTLTTHTLLTLLYIGVFASVIAFYVWNQSVLTIGAARTGMYIYLIPVFSALIAYLWINEPILWVHKLGFVLIIGGIILSNKN